jgi:hypothetical protein
MAKPGFLGINTIARMVVTDYTILTAKLFSKLILVCN